ncbi:hypothetical protein [Alteromonas lipolytica]|uniref:Proteinase inhibitor I42 chagasin domain-containing protein n=1 Tax=Alteromonas lipolytica TaxID=1856405 RepID=A0A1E8FGZ2_9ALTE|nr:hypothetical protein [Alteromonas lipolytica]OFI35200.1 hypothetical protein BFC17_16805 [Alteromonas lipolytica]GGF57564.1 hypothetical protein GCM10011338_07260 [Alteromonas lipolytica]
MFRLIFLFLFSLTACTGNAKAPTNAVSDDDSSTTQQQSGSQLISAEKLVLAVNQTVNFKDLILRVVAIEDSRCAIGEECIWAGQMKIDLEISKNGSNPERVTLEHQREAKAYQIFGYTFKLLNLTPHPQKGKQITLAQQSVELQIAIAD